MKNIIKEEHIRWKKFVKRTTIVKEYEKKVTKRNYRKEVSYHVKYGAYI